MTGFHYPLPAALALALGLAVSGCSGTSNALSTSSLFGSEKPKPAAAAPSAPLTPQARALDVAATSARATKCGYNFDPAKLKAGFLAAEATNGLPIEQMTNVEKAYDAAHAGVMKAIVGQGDYCTEERTKQIKVDLTRHLAGDFTPSQKKQEVAKQETGLFGGLMNNDCPDCNKPLTADDYYDVTGKPKNAL